MADVAAFFDLDRTLIPEPSGRIVSQALREQGLIPERGFPGSGLLAEALLRIGETRPTMELARQAARLSKGIAAEEAREAGKLVAEALLPQVQPYGLVLLEEHRQAGRKLVLATATPRDMVEPFADALGFDGVVATRYRTTDGVYDGSIAGEFVWGRGKYTAAYAWAEANNVDLAQSWAYSDSYFDVPLLSAVGHPHAANPDPRLRIQALIRRWPIVHFDVPAGVPKLFGIEPQRLLQLGVRNELMPFASIDVAGTEHIPAAGPAICVSNHRSYFDFTALLMVFAKAGRPVRVMGKKEMFDAPVAGPVFRSFGGIRVDREGATSNPLGEATRALRAGELVGVLPQGTIPRGRAFFDPELKGKPGAAILASRTGAPVIPIGIWGTDRVWPRSASLPNVAKVIGAPRVEVRVGPPVELTHDDAEDDMRQIMGAVSRLLPAEAHVQREPTAEELARTYPHGRADV